MSWRVLWVLPAAMSVIGAIAVAIALDFPIALCVAVGVCSIIAVLVGRRRTTVSMGVRFTASALIAVVFAGLAYTRHTRADAQIDEVRDTVASVIGPLTADVLSYRAETVEADVDQAKSRLADPFLDEYTALTASTIVPRAKEGQVDTRWEAVGTSMITAGRDRAVVLVFLRGTSVSAAAAAEPTYLVSSVRVSAQRAHDEWLITGLEAL